MIIERAARRIGQWIGVYLGASAIVVAIQQRQNAHPDDMRRVGLQPEDFLSLGQG